MGLCDVVGFVMIADFGTALMRGWMLGMRACRVDIRAM